MHWPQPTAFSRRSRVYSRRRGDSGLVAADDYHRAADLPSFRGERLPAGREIASGEMRKERGLCEPASQ